MSSLEKFQKFAKGDVFIKKKDESKYAVIYTRVSSKRQQEENLSLETQLQGILNFASKNDFEILESFGGTYESAKSDERKEFQKMLKFVNNSRNKVSHILVYSFDRFSRSGANSIYLSDQLKKKGIQIVSVTQPTESMTPSGELLQQVMMIFSNFDNSLRKEKCVNGMIQRLKKGYWVCQAPVGYQYDRTKKEKPLIFDEKAPLVKKAFHLKVIEGYSNIEIFKKLGPLGLVKNHKTLGKILSNPIYAGYISCKLLNGEVVKGNHKPLISEKMFFKANEERKVIENRIRETEVNPNAPLKNFILCEVCETRRLSGYEMKKRGIWYYKCSGRGCKNNVNANKMHEAFLKLLDEYSVDPKFLPTLKKQIIAIFDSLNEDKRIEAKTIKSSLTKLQSKLSTLEERYAFGEVEANVFQKVSVKLKIQIKELETTLFEHQELKRSNIDSHLDFALNMACNLKVMWELANPKNKRILQNIVFPEGIRYDRKNSKGRTFKVNGFFALTNKLSNDYKGIKKGNYPQNANNSPQVELQGVEPWSGEGIE